MSLFGDAPKSKSSQDAAFEQDLGRMFEMFVITVFALLTLIAGLLSLPLGYVLYWSWKLEPERRWIRPMVVYALAIGFVYYWVGYPDSTPWEKLPLSFWPGALIHDFIHPTVKAYEWAYENILKYLKLDIRHAYTHIRALFYAPLVGGPIAAIVLGVFKPDLTTPQAYSFFRQAFLILMTPFRWLPARGILGGGKLGALLALLIQNGVLFGICFGLATRISALGWLQGVGGLILGSATLVWLYEILLNPEFELPSFSDESSKKKREVIVLGREAKRYKQVSFSLKQLQHHVHIVGSSGRGKSSFLSHIIGHHIEQGLGLIFVDLKADSDTVAEITARCKEAGQLGRLKLFNLSRPDLSCAYNPCQRGSATEIKDRIVGAFQWEKQYFKDVAQSFLLTLLRGLVYLRDQRKVIFTLEDIYQATLGPDAVMALQLELNQAQAPERLREDIQGLVQFLRSKDNLKELEGMRTQMKLLLESEFGERLTSVEEGIDFYEAIKNQELIYILLESQKYEDTAKRLGRLILQDLKSCSSEIIQNLPEAERQHCTIIVDEFADLAMEQFVGLLNRARGSKLGIVIAHQEISDLDAVSPSFRDQVMGNTNTTVSFLQKTAESAERVAGLAGTKTVVRRTKQVQEDSFLFLKNRKYTGVESEREVEEYRIHPNTIKRLDVGECVIVGKYPKAWEAHVKVNPPEKWSAPRSDVESWLKLVQQSLGKTSMNVAILNLREKTKLLIHSQIKKQKPGKEEVESQSLGLKTDLAQPKRFEQDDQSPSQDDRF